MSLAEARYGLPKTTFFNLLRALEARDNHELRHWRILSAGGQNDISMSKCLEGAVITFITCQTINLGES